MRHLQPPALVGISNRHRLSPSDTACDPEHDPTTCGELEVSLGIHLMSFDSSAAVRRGAGTNLSLSYSRAQWYSEVRQSPPSRGALARAAQPPESHPDMERLGSAFNPVTIATMAYLVYFLLQCPEPFFERLWIGKDHLHWLAYDRHLTGRRSISAAEKMAG